MSPLLKVIGSYQTGLFDEGAAEIVAYDPNSERLFVVNANKAEVDVLNISDPTNPTLEFELGAGDIVITADRAIAGINSVAVKNGIVAAAVEIVDAADDSIQRPGAVSFFDTDGNFLSFAGVGALPDMVTFTPDGSKVLVANEGEPNDDYSFDPEGSVSIIDISNGVENAVVTNAEFTGFNDQKEALMNKGVRIFGPNATVAQDLEPEYIAVSPDGETAFVTLQENNAFAVIDIAEGQVSDILPLGYKDHSQFGTGNALDASNEDGMINLQNWPVWGMYQPDAIAAYEVNGATYYVTANEGDSRDYDGFSEEERVADVTLDPEQFPNAADLQLEENLGRLNITNTLGDVDNDGEYEQLYAYGARSFSIWDQFGNLVFDSGDELAQITAEILPDDFNSNNDENDSFDSRSDDKGTEPEGVTTGVVDGVTYAFIGLERIGGIMVYDVSQPHNPGFVQYINNRDFSVDAETEEGGTNPAVGDLAPEGLTFISAEDSPNGEPLLVVANEVSGTTTIYSFSDQEVPPQMGTLIFGTTGDDELELPVSDHSNLVFTGSGNDLVDAVALSEVKSSTTSNRLYGGSGDDEQIGGTGDRLLGGSGNDILDAYVGGGNNRLYGSFGNDELVASQNDRLFGGEGHDYLESSDGNNNRLYGDDGDDTLVGGESDRLIAGDGDDQLYAGVGNNTLTGGSGEDEFWIAQADFPQTPHIITDFEDTLDVIGIGGDLGFSAADVGIDQDGADVVISAGNNVMAKVLNTDVSLLSAADIPELNAIVIS